MSHDIHGTLGVSYHGTIGAKSSIHLGVLSGAWYCEGSALGLHVGAWHCSRFGAWSTYWQGSTLGPHQTISSRSC